MSHNLNVTERGTAYASIHAAWHGLGQVVNRAMNAQEALIEARLDFDVEKQHIYLAEGADSLMPSLGPMVPKNFANVRTDSNVPLGVVGSKYHILQNREAFQFFDSIVAEGEAIYETAGAFGAGEKVFITAKLPKVLQIGPGDTMECYVFIVNSHDGSGSVNIAFVLVRPVSGSTFNVGMSSRLKSTRIRHTTNVVSNVRQAHQFLGVTKRNMEETELMFQAMSRIRLDEPTFRKFIETAMNPDKDQPDGEEYTDQFKAKIDKVMNYAHTHPSQQLPTTLNTLYGAFNAIVGYFNNVISYGTPEEKTKILMFGNGARINAYAYDLAASVVETRLNATV